MNTLYIIIETIYLWVHKNISEIIAYFTAGVFYVSVSEEVLHSIFTIATACASWLSVEAIKRISKGKPPIKDDDEKKD